jgi:DNA-binding CsgD family transcriptional regulator/tetratricopeptide (TPR) repeat protein
MRAVGRVSGIGAVASAFVGREDELARLRAIAAVVAAGDGQVVVLTGAAGIGKSRLASEAVRACATHGLGVFSGVADEVEQRRPFGVVRDALGVRDAPAGPEREIARLFELGEAGGVGLEGRIADLLVAVVEEACRGGPVVVLLGDLQWADESSLVVVNQLARLASSCPLLLLCVLRPYPESAALRGLLAALGYRAAHRIELEGLAAGEVSDLAAGLTGAPPGVSLRRVLAEAGGNPFYAAQLLACLVQDGGVVVSGDGIAETDAVALPPSLALTILGGLRVLPEPTVDVLRAAAVVGRTFSVSEISLISPTRVADVVAALEPAERSGIVIAEGERLAFRHDLLREAIYEDLSPAARRGLHRELAGRLAGSGANLERVAAQVMLGAEPGDADAISWLRRAASEASASPPIASELLWRARALCSEGGPLRMAVLVELVRPLLWTGQAARAEEVCVEAFAGTPPAAEEPLFWMGLVNSRILQGRFAEARETSERAGACVALTESDRLHAMSSRALCGLYLGDPEGVVLARRIVEDAPTSVPKGIAQEVIAQWELFTGHADRALAAYEQVDSMREPPALESRIWRGSRIRVRMWEGLALLDLDRIDDAVAVLDDEIAAKLAVPALPHAFLASCRYHQGRFDEALHECRAAIAAGEAAGSFTPASAGAIESLVALRRGDLERAEQLAARAEQARSPAEAAGDTIVRWVRVLLFEAARETELAADAAAVALERYLRAGFASYVAWHAPDLVRVALAAGRADQAQHAVLAAERVTCQLPVSSRRSASLRARGLLTCDTSLLLDAVAASREVARPIDLALSLRDAAAGLARGGHQARARPLATEALGLLVALGLAGDGRHARAELRHAGLTIGARTRHARERDGWSSLTRAELQVVRLLATGASNPEIAQALYVSKRTVGWHLSNVFRKLSVSSRVEVVAELLRRERP